MQRRGRLVQQHTANLLGAEPVCPLPRSFLECQRGQAPDPREGDSSFAAVLKFAHALGLRVGFEVAV